jgi:tRNA(Met) cytidine acetyltransferase
MRELVERLVAEAREVDERRLLVLAGDAQATRDRAGAAISAADLDEAAVRSLGESPDLPGILVDPRQTTELLGTTQDAIVLDCHAACRPNAIGRVAGAVDGGGLLVLLTPSLDAWPEHRDGFDESLAVPPFRVEDVAGNFRTRLVETLRQHPGVAVVSVDQNGDGDETIRTGLTEPVPRRTCALPTPPAEPAFPTGAYDACVTSDQADAVAAFEGICDEPTALVLEADRGRGKSAAAGIAAASLALDGNDVLVTAPDYRNAREIFVRAEALLVELGELADRDPDDHPRRLATETGRIRFAAPTDAVDLPHAPDVVIVDEAAALPVRTLESFLAADAIAFATTIHGYEGAGRGFSVRFRDRLADARHTVRDVRLDEPIRYAAGDPVEVWSFRALALDASPATDQVVADASPETVTYEDLDPEELVENDALLREAFGLLVLAHYRTEPNDLARLLDAPNVTVRALRHDGHVVAIALLAQEGNLPAGLRASMYEGHRVRGNMLPDVLTSQLRDENAGAPVGRRVLRIATHPAVRSRGLGSHLLDRISAEFEPEVDWLGAGFGATPELLSFWRENGFRAVHLSTTRNDASGEHSAIVIDPCPPAGEDLLDRHTTWSGRRLPPMLADPLEGVDPYVVLETLRAVDSTPALDLSSFEWRHVAGIPHGAAIFDTAPRPVRRLAFRHFVDPIDAGVLSTREERLLVAKTLQARPWEAVAADLDYHSASSCMRAFGDAVAPLVDAYGDDVALDERGRFE